MYVNAVLLLGLLLLAGLADDCGGWIFGKYKGRELDGSLRCYQCDTNSTEPEAKLCSLANWKHANVTEKRNMIMQCPRRKSAFCHLVISEENPEYAARGCHGPRYGDGNGPEAHPGCFHIATPPTRRGCLCDTVLCNRQAKSDRAASAFLLLVCSSLHISLSVLP